MAKSIVEWCKHRDRRASDRILYCVKCGDLAPHRNNMKNLKITNLEKNLRRIDIIKILGNAGICNEYMGKVEACPMYAEDCLQTCTYAKIKNDEKK